MNTLAPTLDDKYVQTSGTVLMTGVQALVRLPLMQHQRDLAAISLWGTQQVNMFEGATYDGVFGIWYGKGSGVDRCGDVFRHANAAGTSKFGGPLARRILGYHPSGELQVSLAVLEAQLAVNRDFHTLMDRVPRCCSHYPHNRSTKLLDGSHALAGIEL
jgi:TPP-dependent indolepyruvate ferredoxin oxidoreductase alpha subunit